MTLQRLLRPGVCGCGAQCAPNRNVTGDQAALLKLLLLKSSHRQLTVRRAQDVECRLAIRALPNLTDAIAARTDVLLQSQWLVVSAGERPGQRLVLLDIGAKHPLRGTHIVSPNGGELFLAFIVQPSSDVASIEFVLGVFLVCCFDCLSIAHFDVRRSTIRFPQDGKSHSSTRFVGPDA